MRWVIIGQQWTYLVMVWEMSWSTAVENGDEAHGRDMTWPGHCHDDTGTILGEA